MCALRKAEAYKERTCIFQKGKAGSHRLVAGEQPFPREAVPIPGLQDDDGAGLERDRLRCEAVRKAGSPPPSFVFVFPNLVAFPLHSQDTSEA